MDYNLLNICNLEQLTKENITDEYLNLQLQYKNLLVEIENLRQENYKYKSSIIVLENTKTDIEHENDQLQSENINLCNELKKCQDQISCLTNQNEIILNNNSETCEQHQKLIRELKIELEKTQRTIITINETNNNLIKDNEKLNDDLLRLKNEIHAAEDIQEMKLMFEQQILDLNEFRCKNNDLNCELNEIKNILEYKNQQLIDANLLKESLQEEIVTLRVELDSLKTTTANPSSKGNSLFGEVYDSRQQLQKKLCILKKHYLDMKSKYTVKLTENQKLSNENLILTKQWRDEISNRSDTEYSWKEAHDQAIESLNENITFLKNEIKNLKKFSTKVPITEKWMLDNVKDLFERNQKLVIETEEKMNKRIFSDLVVSERLNFVERELSKWKSTATNYEIEKNNLKLELDALKAQNVPALNDPEELIEILNDIENKENLSVLSNNSLLNATVESDTSFDIAGKYLQQLRITKSDFDTKSDYETKEIVGKIKNIKIGENNSSENSVERTKIKNSQNEYSTPEPPKLLIPRKKRFVKSVKFEDTK